MLERPNNQIYKPRKSILTPVISILLFLSTTSLLAQVKHSISGYVKEIESGESLPGVNVYIPSLKIGTITNLYGFYSLTLTAKEYAIYYSYAGYQNETVSLMLTRDTTINVNLEGVTLQEVVITGQARENASQDNRMSIVSVPVKQIMQIPSLLGEKDVFKALQLMPGVQTGSEGSTGLYVRGGGPDQNLIILDDAPVYNASHLFGFFSIFNGDALKSVELIKGGFPAQYGGRLSSVVEMTMKDGNKQRFSGEAGIGLISSRLVLEGPLKKNVSSYIISGRRTYIDVISKPFRKGNDSSGYYFYDLNAKVNYEFGPKNKLYISGYFGRDKFAIGSIYADEIKEKANLYWQNATSTIRWNHLFSPKVFSNTSLIYSRYNLNIKDHAKDDYNVYALNYVSGIRDFALKYDIDYHPSTNYHLKTGIHVINHRFSPSAIVKTSEETLIETREKTIYESLETGLYVENRIKIGQKFKANAGLRISHFIAENKQHLNPEPRLAINYILGKNFSAKAGYAEMNQFIHLLSNTGIGLPTDLWVPSTSRISPQFSRQISGGIAKDYLSNDVTITIEGYYKISKNILGYKPGASFMLFDDSSDGKNLTWQDNVTAGSGKAYGAEFLVHKKSGKLSGWIGYTLAWTKLRFDEVNFGKEFYARYDRRHDLSLVSIYSITPKINFSAVWVYGTGNAITLPLGEYPGYVHQPILDVREISGDNFVSNYFNQVTDYGAMNNFRMKPYNRLDLSFQFLKKKGNYERTFEIGLYNAYNRKNPFFYFIEKSQEGMVKNKKLKQVSIFPAIPSITYSIKF